MVLYNLGSNNLVVNKLGSNNLVLVHGVQDKKRVWVEVELQGAQGNRKAKVFQVSNDDAAVAQRRLEDKQLEEKTNMDCLDDIKKALEEPLKENKAEEYQKENKVM
ncbi:hypothetical protein Tco_1279159 [Tanacetum coccineum]